MSILERVVLRTQSKELELMKDFILSVENRISVRLLPYVVMPFPGQLESIVVDVVVAMMNQHELNHEGVKTERVDAYSISFMEDLLSPYDKEIQCYKRKLQADFMQQDGRVGVVRFL